MARPMKLWIHSARQIVTPCPKSSYAVKVLEQTDTNGCSIVIDQSGRIAAVGYDDAVKAEFGEVCEKTFNAQGLSIIPGLVDGHNHPVWAGDRVNEFAMKLAGASYMEIHEAGGGINYTVDQTRKATHDELYKSFVERMDTLLKSGVTLVECKSGYGLDFETELKMLQVVNRAMKDPEVKIDISVTYCGGHSVPKGHTAEEATLDIVNNQIPKLKELCDSGDLHIDNVDVFCEKGVFDVSQTRRILQTGRDAGWNLNFHSEELNCLNSAEHKTIMAQCGQCLYSFDTVYRGLYTPHGQDIFLPCFVRHILSMGVELKALAMSHLEEISDAAITMMSEHQDCYAVILPTTAYLLHLKPPPVRKMIDSGVQVALGTDFNPNAYCLSMPLVMNIACVMLRMTMPEALTAATINSAKSLKKEDTHGSIEVGKFADLVLLEAASWEHLIYQMGNSKALIKYVVKSGDFAYSRD